MQNLVILPGLAFWGFIVFKVLQFAAESSANWQALIQ